MPTIIILTVKNDLKTIDLKLFVVKSKLSTGFVKYDIFYILNLYQHYFNITTRSIYTELKNLLNQNQHTILWCEKLANNQILFIHPIVYLL